MERKALIRDAPHSHRPGRTAAGDELAIRIERDAHDAVVRGPEGIIIELAEKIG